MIKMPPGRIQHLRLRAQHLHRPDNQPDLNVGRLMAGVFALQAQDAVAAYRSIAEILSLLAEEVQNLGRFHYLESASMKINQP